MGSFRERCDTLGVPLFVPYARKGDVKGRAQWLPAWRRWVVSSEMAKSGEVDEFLPGWYRTAEALDAAQVDVKVLGAHVRCWKCSTGLDTAMGILPPGSPKPDESMIPTFHDDIALLVDGLLWCAQPDGPVARIDYRASKAEGRSYWSQGCPACHVLLGRNMLVRDWLFTSDHRILATGSIGRTVVREFLAQGAPISMINARLTANHLGHFDDQRWPEESERDSRSAMLARWKL